MAVGDYSTTPGSNTSISGISIAENCPAANMNNAFRQLMADVRVMYNNLPATGNYVLKDGSVAFTGQPTFSGRGAFLHMNSTTNLSGRVFVQAAGGSPPSGMQNGDILLEYD